MSGRAGLLSVVLAVQLVVIAAMLLFESGAGSSDEGPLLSFDPGAVTGISITGTGDDEASGDTTTLVITREGDDWRLPNGLPANGDKVSDVLEKLSSLSAPYPVATTAAAVERFQVADDDFQRHVVVSADCETVADLYLGTSPGYQQVHARRADGDAVYSVGISNYQVPFTADDWLDKTLLQPNGDITAVTRGDAWTLTHGDQGWRLGGESGTGEAANQDAVDKLVRRLKELRVTGALEPPADDAGPDAVLTVTDSEGPYRLELVKDDDDNRYRVHSDRREGWFGLAAYLADNVLVDRQSLVAAEQPASPEPPAEASQAGGTVPEVDA